MTLIEQEILNKITTFLEKKGLSFLLSVENNNETVNDKKHLDSVLSIFLEHQFEKTVDFSKEEINYLLENTKLDKKFINNYNGAITSKSILETYSKSNYYLNSDQIDILLKKTNFDLIANNKEILFNLIENRKIHAFNDQQKKLVFEKLNLDNIFLAKIIFFNGFNTFDIPKEARKNYLEKANFFDLNNYSWLGGGISPSYFNDDITSLIINNQVKKNLDQEELIWLMERLIKEKNKDQPKEKKEHYQYQYFKLLFDIVTRNKTNQYNLSNKNILFLLKNLDWEHLKKEQKEDLMERVLTSNKAQNIFLTNEGFDFIFEKINQFNLINSHPQLQSRGSSLAFLALKNNKTEELNLSKKIIDDIIYNANLQDKDNDLLKLVLTNNKTENLNLNKDQINYLMENIYNINVSYLKTIYNKNLIPDEKLLESKTIRAGLVNNYLSLAVLNNQKEGLYLDDNQWKLLLKNFKDSNEALILALALPIEFNYLDKKELDISIDKKIFREMVNKETIEKLVNYLNKSLVNIGKKEKKIIVTKIFDNDCFSKEEKETIKKKLNPELKKFIKTNYFNLLIKNLWLNINLNRKPKTINTNKINKRVENEIIIDKELQKIVDDYLIKVEHLKEINKNNLLDEHIFLLSKAYPDKIKEGVVVYKEILKINGGKEPPQEARQLLINQIEEAGKEINDYVEQYQDNLIKQKINNLRLNQQFFNVTRKK